MKKQLSDSLLYDSCANISQSIFRLQNDNPVASIIFCAHNEEEYLIPTLTSLSQLETHFPVEIIAVNNASKDRTAEILNTSGIRVIDEPIKGISYARDAGLRAARGDIIIQTDADTKMPKKWVNAHMRHFKDDAIVGVSGGISFEGVHALYYLYRTGAIGFYILMSIPGKRKGFKCIGGANMSYRKDAALAVGGFQKGSDLGEDVLLFDKLGKIGEIDQEIGKNITVTTSGSRFDTAEKVIQLTKKATKKMIPTLQRGYIVLEGKTFQDYR